VASGVQSYSKKSEGEYGKASQKAKCKAQKANIEEQVKRQNATGEGQSHTENRNNRKGSFLACDFCLLRFAF
jgi:hypothetical protein